MNEVLAIFLVLLLIYFLECLSLVPEQSLVFRTRWIREWKPARSLCRLDRFRREVYLSNPVPGLGDIAVCEAIFPLAIDDPSKKTEELRREFERMLDTKAVRRQLRRYRRALLPVYWDSYLLFALTFGAFPLIAFRFGLRVSLLFLPTILLAVINAVYSFRRVHRVFHPHSTGERREKTIALLLSPLGAIRAPGLLLRQSLSGFHPLAVAAAAMPHPEARQFASRVLRDLKFSPELADTNQTTRRAKEQWRAAVWVWARKEFGDPDSLVGPPAKRFSAALSYCPRCEQEYVVAKGECRDCRITLQLYGSADLPRNSEFQPLNR